MLTEHLEDAYLAVQLMSDATHLDFERTSQIMDPSKVYVTDIVCRIVIADLTLSQSAMQAAGLHRCPQSYLTSSPIHAFNLDGLAVLDGAAEGNIWMPSILSSKIRVRSSHST